MKIFVANLNFKITDKALRELFSHHGEVSSAKIVTDKVTQRSKGFGFVEMLNDSEAKAAIQKLDGKEFQGRAINVKEAIPKESN